MSAFVALCEGYLGIKPHLNLWKYFFTLVLHKRKDKRKDHKRKRKEKEYVVLMESASIRLRKERATEYMAIFLKTSHKGWHSSWFYLRDDPCSSLPLFTNSYLNSSQQEWCQTPSREENKRITNHLKAIKILKNAGLQGMSVIMAYHVRRLAPLMARALPMYAMRPAEDGVCPVEGHPVMRSEKGYIQFVSETGWSLLVVC
jgi:hypothetical protein